MTLSLITKTWASGDTFLASDVETIIKGSINNASTQVNNNVSAITNNTINVGLLTNDIQDNANSIVSTDGVVSGHTTLLGTHTTNIGILSADTAINTNQIGLNTIYITGLTSDVNALEIQQTTNNGDIIQLSADTASNTTAIGNIETYWEEDGSVNHIKPVASVTHTKVGYLNIQTLSTGTQTDVLGIDASGNVISAVISTDSSWISGGTASLIVKDAGGNNTGDYSVAGGYHPIVTSDYSVAIGFNPHTYGSSSAAFNNGTTAEGNSSFAIGSYSNASGSTTFAGGQNTQSKGNTSFNFSRATSVGDSIVDGTGSVILGTLDSNIGTGDYSAIIGGKNNTINNSVDGSVILGGNGITATTSDTVYTPKLNIGTLPTGTLANNVGIDSSGNLIVGSIGATGSTAFWSNGAGTDAIISTPNVATGSAIGDGSFSVGFNCDADGDQSVSLGHSNMADGDQSVAIGYSNTAVGTASFASGYGTHANGYYSTSMGQGSTADGDYSSACNETTTASARASHAGGRLTQANGIGSFIHQYTSTSNKGIVDANYSAILGGYDNVLTSTATRSVVLGGTGISGTTADTVYTPKLETVEVGEGIIMASPDGTRYNVTIANGGTISITAV